jgi:hypothetical protein
LEKRGKPSGKGGYAEKTSAAIWSRSCPRGKCAGVMVQEEGAFENDEDAEMQGCGLRSGTRFR